MYNEDAFGTFVDRRSAESGFSQLVISHSNISRHDGEECHGVGLTFSKAISNSAPSLLYRLECTCVKTRRVDPCVPCTVLSLQLPPKQTGSVNFGTISLWPALLL